MTKPISREEAAADVLVSWERGQHSLRRALNLFSEARNITDWKIRTAIHSLVFETIRRLNTLDWILDNVLSQSKLTDLDIFTRNLLRVAVYLIKYGTNTPALPTNEAVTIIKRRRIKRLGGFINAVLRSVQHFQIEVALESLPEVKRKALKLSTPPWFVEYTEQILGVDEAHSFLVSGLENPPVYVRVNTLISPISETIHELTKDDFECISIPEIPEILRLRKGTSPVTNTSAYQRNAIYLQNLASGLVAHVVNPTSHALLVDLCAAPGSKTSHLSQLMENTGCIIAVDWSSSRVHELRNVLNRLDVQNTHIVLADSLKLPFREALRADYVLVDPPCSNTGVIQTRPELKWSLTPEVLSQMRKIQLALLRQGSQIVAQEGYLVYSTCSISLEENEFVIRDFLAKHPKFETLSAQPWLGIPAFEGLVNCQRLFPHRHNTEGFFIAKMRRVPLL